MPLTSRIMKILFGLIAGILLVFVVSGCSALTSTAVNTDPGKMIRVPVGQEFNIVLKANPTTGYDWEYVGVYEWIQPLDKIYQPDNTGLVGSGGTDVFTFKAHGQGNAVLDFVV